MARQRGARICIRRQSLPGVNPPFPGGGSRPAQRRRRTRARRNVSPKPRRRGGAGRLAGPLRQASAARAQSKGTAWRRCAVTRASVRPRCRSRTHQESSLPARRRMRQRSRSAEAPSSGSARERATHSSESSQRRSCAKQQQRSPTCIAHCASARPAAAQRGQRAGREGADAIAAPAMRSQPSAAWTSAGGRAARQAARHAALGRACNTHAGERAPPAAHWQTRGERDVAADITTAPFPAPFSPPRAAR